MALKYADRVKEAATNKPDNGSTAAFNVAGADPGYQTFSAGIGNGNDTIVSVQEVDANGVPSGDWEEWVGTVDSGTVTRKTFIRSSTGSFIDWSGKTNNLHLSCVSINEHLENSPGPLGTPGTSVWYNPTFIGINSLTSLSASFPGYQVAPFIIRSPMMLTGMRVGVSTGSGAGRNFYFVVYKQEGLAREPMRLIYNSAEQEALANGIIAVTGITQLLLPGIYWMGILNESNLVGYLGYSVSGVASPNLSSTLGFDSGLSMSPGVHTAGMFKSVGSYGAPSESVIFDGSLPGNFPVVQIQVGAP